MFNRLHEKYRYLEHGHESEGWTSDDGYPKNLPLQTYPMRGTVKIYMLDINFEPILHKNDFFRDLVQKLD